MKGGVTALYANYLKVALRNLLKHKLYSLINVGGLAVGLTCAMLIFLWVRDEESFDRFHVHANDTYRVNWDFNWEGNEGVGPGTPPPLAAALKDHIPDVKAVVRLRPMPSVIVRSGDTFFNEHGVLAADSDFLEMFSFPMLAGNASSALRDPNSVVLTRDLAWRLFGGGDPMGRSILIDEKKENRYGAYQNLFTVTGVVQNPPENSHIQFSMITSMSSYPEVAWFNWSWVWMQVVTYVQLREGASPAPVEAEIPALVQRFGSAGLHRAGISYDNLIKEGGRWNFVLQPLTDVYLGSAAIGNRLGPIGDRTQVVLFSLVALFIVAIACINFMNITTARSAGRAREIGVRKALGSERRSLFNQFLVESMVFSFVATAIALLLAELFLSPFNRLSGKSLVLSLVDPVWLPGAILVLAVVVGFASGLYPGLYLSSFRPAQIIRGSLSPRGSGRRLRNALVVVQFTVTIGFMACTLLVKDQMDFVRKRDLGFDQRNIVVISNENQRLGGNAEAFRDALMSNPQVVGATVATGVPPDYGFQDSYAVEGRTGDKFQLNSYMADDHFVATLGMTIVKGRGFSKDFSDSASVILNESAARLLGLADPLGAVIDYPGGGWTRYRVIGVVKDFHFSSLYSPISPFAIFHISSKSYTIPASFVAVRVRQNDLSATLRTIGSVWRSFAPATPFEYTFLDESIEAQYRSAERLGRLFMVFSGLSILIACVGLFGLAAFATERRTKEIGIRKVLGATEADVVGLLSRDFVLLVILAALIACPLSWLAMNPWLQGFAYRTDIHAMIFVASGGIALVIAMLTVGSHAVKAALANPITSLRYE